VSAQKFFLGLTKDCGDFVRQAPRDGRALAELHAKGFAAIPSEDDLFCSAPCFAQRHMNLVLTLNKAR